MRLIRGTIFDADGQRHTVYGIRVKYKEGAAAIEDISPHPRDALLFGLLLHHFPAVRLSNIADFAADFINLLNKYS